MVQTIYDIIKARGSTIRVEAKVDEENPDNFGKSEGSNFIITIPMT